ncbi:hypothetical protein Mal52_02520 [Symmachiella dynata]|uniref:Uncharacterized protein n=1 Tax=Symmachiella dynata TaxID=2527995 RepID=A0A517ZH50_9PLAN|nr:hypothetical protein Mal52_02520 [Symmachiella dynata]
MASGRWPEKKGAGGQTAFGSQTLKPVPQASGLRPRPLTAGVRDVKVCKVCRLGKIGGCFIRPSPESQLVKYRPYLLRSLWVGAVLLLLFLVVLFVWLALSSLGDTGGAQAAKAITLSLAICLGFDLIGLIVLLTLAELERTKPNEPADEGD